MKYGKKPVEIGEFNVRCDEMMFYQYLPVKLSGAESYILEERLSCFDDVVGAAIKDFIYNFGYARYEASYIYVTAKYMYQSGSCSFNRHGFHSDGFMTDDINYIWSDKSPTLFNTSPFELTQDDDISLEEMESQADPNYNIRYSNNVLLRLDQYCIHKVADVQDDGMRCFLKVSFSRDKYDLKGNAKNYKLDYQWEYRQRNLARNIPQKLIV